MSTTNRPRTVAEALDALELAIARAQELNDRLKGRKR